MCGQNNGLRLPVALMATGPDQSGGPLSSTKARARLSIVPSWYHRMSGGSCLAKSCSTLSMTLTAASESPPSAKKLSCIPIGDTSRMRSQIRISCTSTAFRGGTRARVAGASSAVEADNSVRSILPLAVSGNADRVKNAAGTM